MEQVIHNLDSLLPNSFSTEQKLRWLCQLDRELFQWMKENFQDVPGQMPDYRQMEDSLLMPPPFDRGYRYWLEAQIHYCNDEPERYNMAYSMFEAVEEAFKKDFLRRHVPKDPGRFRF